MPPRRTALDMAADTHNNALMEVLRAHGCVGVNRDRRDDKGAGKGGKGCGKVGGAPWGGGGGGQWDQWGGGGG